MPHYNYSAVDLHGLEKCGCVVAPDGRQAAAMLQEQGLFPTALLPSVPPIAGLSRPAAPAPGRGSAMWSCLASRWPFRRCVRPRELATFTRQLSALLRAGFPMLGGLELLARQERSPELRRVLAGLSRSIQSGDPLSVAMEPEAGVFSRLYRNMIKAGEAGGVLAEVLERMACFEEKKLKMKGKIKAALLYPLSVMGVAALILLGLLLFVVPKFQQIFADLLKGAPLPPLTQGVITISDLVRHHFLAGLAVLIVMGIGLRLYLRTSGGTRMLATWIIRLPLIGDLLLKDLIARTSRTLGTLLASGVPMLTALLITRDTCGNARLGAALTVVHDRVKAGATLAGPLAEAEIFPPLVSSMIEVGEQTGRLNHMLHQIAVSYEDEVDLAVAGLSSLLEPLLIVCLAVMVGTIVLALFLPIVRIVQLLT